MESAEGFGLKFSIFSHLNVYMKIYEYKRSKLFNDLCRPLNSFNHIHIAIGPIVSKFCIQLSAVKGMNICLNSLSHMTNMATTPIFGKTTFKILLQNHLTNDFETWYVTLDSQILPRLFKCRPCSFFTARLNLLSGENART